MGVITGMVISISVCVVLPVLIVWFVMRAKINKDNRNSEVLMEAIRRNELQDTDKLSELFSKKERSRFDRMMTKLSWGLVLTLIGIGMTVLTCLIWSNNPKDDDYLGCLFFTICILGTGLGLLISFAIQKYLLKNKDEEELDSPQN